MSIILKNVSYTYAPGTVYETKAVSNLSLRVEKGEFVGIMGRTGCGKSTVLQLIAGLLTPAAGEILIDGKNINDRNYDRNELRKKIGVVFQHPEYQLFETTVERDVAFGLKQLGWPEQKITQAVKNALETVGLEFEKVKDRSPMVFSEGEKRRIAIAGVLAAEPEVLVLDEPIAGLDPIGREAFLKLLGRLNQKKVTILMISHNTDALAEYARRIVILKAGKIFMDGPLREVFSCTEALTDSGIGFSQAKQTALMLNQRGFAIPPEVVRYEDLLPYLISIGRRSLK